VIKNKKKELLENQLVKIKVKLLLKLKLKAKNQNKIKIKLILIHKIFNMIHKKIQLIIYKWICLILNQKLEK
jgi:hypothetical protein